MTGSRHKPVPFPTREAVLEFIRDSTTPVGKREIARAFHLHGDDRVLLKQLLHDLQTEGAVERGHGHGRRVAPPSALPEVAVVIVSAINAEGEVIAQPQNWPDSSPPPRIVMRPEKRGQPALAEGDRVLARLARVGDNFYLGQTMRRLDGGGPTRVLGVFQPLPDGRGRVVPTDRRAKTELTLVAADCTGLESGELLVVEPLPARQLGLHQARLVERLGDTTSPRAISLISIHSFGLPTVFSQGALDEAATPPSLNPRGRLDLRDLPLVTIDGEDARDFDDAVWAEPDPDPAQPGGWRAVVAIADVAHYVRPGGALDRAAYERGNSTYFPDRVVPMLPEALSNELCSLKPGVDRACLAVELWIDRHGNLHRHHFHRAIMRSAARLTYTRVQAAADGRPDEDTARLWAGVLAPLYGVYRALTEARVKRGTLDLDLPERQIKLDTDGKVVEILPRPRFDSHKLIEELMIAANVAAAEALEAKGSPCLYRVHDQPSRDRLEAVREFLASLDLGLSLGGSRLVKPGAFNHILHRVADTPHAHMISEVVLRAQAQAQYHPENIGHFGLALRRYAHFTSPIRRRPKPRNRPVR
ncbi:ribonuclease R [uncultured Gammaproteobacteria bacterium]